MGVKGLKSVLREIFEPGSKFAIQEFWRKNWTKEIAVLMTLWITIQAKNFFFYLVDSILIHGIVIIFRGTLTNEDVHWNIELGTVHLAFPCSAVSEPTLITVHRWKPTVLSPPLQEHEALVSNVIEISSNSRGAFKFEAEVKMSFTHSSPGLHGYELVLYKRIDNETGTWEEVTDVEDFKTISGWRKSLQIC